MIRAILSKLQRKRDNRYYRRARLLEVDKDINADFPYDDDPTAWSSMELGSSSESDSSSMSDSSSGWDSGSEL